MYWFGSWTCRETETDAVVNLMLGKLGELASSEVASLLNVDAEVNCTDSVLSQGCRPEAQIRAKPLFAGVDKADPELGVRD